MHVTASRCLALLCVALPARAAAPPADLGSRVRAVLTRHCAACHGEQPKPKGGLGHVSDLQRLLDRGAVVAGSLDRSPLYQRVHDGEMPPPGKGNAFTAGDRETLRQWIVAGAPVGSARISRLSERDLVRLVQADLASLPERQRRFVRYFGLAHLAGERDQVRHALTKLVNSLSWHPRLTAPRSLADGLLFRIDLRDYRWSARQWDRLTVRYPYAATDSTDRLLVRADWFVATASRPPAYHDLLVLPSSDRALERLLQVDVPLNLEEHAAVRAGFNGSGVARANRLIERHDAAHGAYWRSYDFSDNTGRQNLFEYPLGPAPGPAGFKHAGGEAIFHLPNGLQAYLLVDAGGARVDKAPGDIVSDPKRPDRLVENGLSCIGCHVTGILPKDDQIREHARKNPKAFASEVQDEILALYAPAKRFRALVSEDNARFDAALKKLGIPLGEPEPVLAVVTRYEEMVDRQKALAELGISAEELAARLTRSAELARALGPLLTRGGVQRQVFEESYSRLLEPTSSRVEVKGAGPLHVHRRAVTALALSPDGRSAASADAAGTVCVHDLATGRTRELGSHADEVRALAFSPDGERLLSAGADRAVIVWNVSSGKRLHRLLGHTAGVRAVAVGPSGRWAVSASEDRTLRIWDLDKGAERLAITGHAGTVHAVAVSPDGTRIASGSADRTARTWRADTGAEVERVTRSAEVRAVAFDSDGRVVQPDSAPVVQIRDVRIVVVRDREVHLESPR